MEILDNLISLRIVSMESDIVAGAFHSEEELEMEISRLKKIMVSSAVINGIKKLDAEEYIDTYFTSYVKEFYQKNQQSNEMDEFPENYAFKEAQKEIEELIASGNIDQADERIVELSSILSDEEMVSAAIADGLYTKQDAEFFLKVALPHFSDMMDEVRLNDNTKMNFAERIKKGVSFIFKGKNPYDNQTVKTKKEKTKVKEFDKLKYSIMSWCMKHKGFCTVAGVVAVVGGVFAGTHNLHEKVEVLEELPTEPIYESQLLEPQIEEATFEVDEFHHFNLNDEQTHIEKLQLLAQAFMERGVPVLSEEECSKANLNGKMAVSVEQLNNWLISINIEDMDDLTFTKLLKDDNTDIEELTNDFGSICNVLGSIYTTKEDEPFVYEFISNKEYSNYIKTYEEAIIENQKGNSKDLIALIKNRVYNSNAPTTNGPLGCLSTLLFYQQFNVYNVNVIGKDIMDLYVIKNSCGTESEKSLYADDWSEYMLKAVSKFEAARIYQGTEKEAYEEYLKTLTDEQDDNKVYIEAQVLLYLELHNVQLGEWDVLEEIVKIPGSYTEEINSQSNGNYYQNAATTSTETATRTISKEPTTPAEKKVQKQTEKEMLEKSRKSFEKTVKDYAKRNNKLVTEDANGNYHIGVENIVVNGNTMGAYDKNQDYKGTTYDDEGYDGYKEDHKQDVENVKGVGDVVITDQNVIVNNPNVSKDQNGNIVDSDGNKVTIGSEEEIDKIQNGSSNNDQWVTTEEGDVQYSKVDNVPPPLFTYDDSNNIEQDNNSSNNIEQDNNILTPEEQEQLNQILNKDKEPIAGEIVDTKFEPLESATSDSKEEDKLAKIEELKKERASLKSEEENSLGTEKSIS